MSQHLKEIYNIYTWLINEYLIGMLYAYFGDNPTFTSKLLLFKSNTTDLLFWNYQTSQNLSSEKK